METMPAGQTLTCELTMVSRRHLAIRLVITDEETGQEQVAVLVLDQEVAMDLACRFLANNHFLVLAPERKGNPLLN